MNKLILLAAILWAYPVALFAIEKPEYELLDESGDVEIRRYPPLIVARTLVDAGFNKAGNEGFRRLGGYIFGDNVADQKISMTAPVAQEPAESGEGYWVTFFMPSEFKMEALPEPVDPMVEITEMPSKTFVVLRYRGGWRESMYQEHELTLKAWLEQQDEWQVTGEPVWARYNPPMMPSFFRTNEVMIPVSRRSE